MQPQRHWKDRAMTGSEVITDVWEVTKAILARLAEWVLFACMVMNIIEILPGVVLAPLVSNLVLSVQAVTLDVAGFGLASMADHARDNGDEEAARSGKITGWLLIGLMIVTLLLVSIGLLWPQTQRFTTPAEKGLILARVIMTVIYGHVVHRLRRSSHPAQAASATSAPASTLDYAEIARQLYALFPPPTPQIDYQELAERLVPLMSIPQVDYQAIKEQLEATCKATIVREITAMRTRLDDAEGGAGSSLRSRSQSHLLALEPSARATFERHEVAPASGAGATPRSHLLAPEPLKRATHQSHMTASVPGAETTPARQPELVAGAIEERLLLAYQELTTQGGRVSGRALAARARCNRTTATEWLQRYHRGAKVEPEPRTEAAIERQPEPDEASA